MKYNPMSKEFQEKAKELGLTGYQLVQEYKNKGKIVNSTYVNIQNNERWAKNAGCSSHNEYHRLTYNNNAEYIRKREKERLWEKGIYEPMELKEDCTMYLGIFKGEVPFKGFLEKNIFEYVKGSGKGSHDKCIDFICKNPKQEFIDKYPHLKLERNREYKIQLKLRCLNKHEVWSGWVYRIGFNNSDYFLLFALDNRCNLNALHIWMIFKNDIIRGNKFWNRDTFCITDKSYHLSKLKRYELNDELIILEELYKKLKN